VEDGALVGFLSCNVMPYRAQPARELMLYEIGVHRDLRRRGIGRALVAEMTQWMAANGIPEVWLGADNAGAEAFYLECGFTFDDPATYMILRLGN
jgi:GNAT superfamily N-acetyltransferase